MEFHEELHRLRKEFKDLGARVAALEQVSDRKLLTEILSTVRRVEEQGVKIMATQQELSDKLDAIPPVLDAIVADEQAQKDEIQALKDQIAAGTPVSQAQLDSLDARASAILSRLQGIDAAV